jgi:hypothetical protein
MAGRPKVRPEDGARELASLCTTSFAVTSTLTRGRHG